MIAVIEILNGSCAQTTPLLGVFCHPYARIWYNLPVCKIWRF